ncbi:hypothetical protein PQX77_018273 [Marasmius sp. AFHP31]|nr:hypothetical protein PQX77_018273 [Marasmius sp. AFHP31]
MPRPRLYHTKEQRREANRVKNRSFYNKHKSDILTSKKLQREKDRRAAEKEEISLRKKRREQREKRGPKEGSQATTTTTTVEQSGTDGSVTALKDRLSTLDAQLLGMKAKYRAEIPREGLHLQQLCEQTVRWQQEQYLPSMKRPTHESPLMVAKRHVEAQLAEYQVIEDEYFYAIRNYVGRHWSEKRTDFTNYKYIVSEYRDTLNELQAVVDFAGADLDMEDLSLIYRRVYPLHCR